jgi:hypothetical protein
MAYIYLCLYAYHFRPHTANIRNSISNGGKRKTGEKKGCLFNLKKITSQKFRMACYSGRTVVSRKQSLKGDIFVNI